MRPARVLATIAVLTACGAIEQAPKLAPPVNRCPQFDCAAYAAQTPLPTCQSGACEVSQQVDYVLVVAVPQTSLFAPGQVFAVRSSDLFTRATAKCKGRSCVALPPLGDVAGNYLVNPAGAELVRRVLGNPSGFTSLPVHVTMRPLWSPLASETPSDAADLGLPLETIFGTTRIPTYPSPPPGPGGGPSIEYRVSVPTGRYERTVAPVAPFDDAFPPDIRIVAAPTAKYDELKLLSEATTIDTFTFPVSREGGTLDGFTAELVDAISGRRVSTVARLHAGSTEAALRVLRTTAAETRRLDLRLAPPGGGDQTLPVLSYAFVAGTTPPIRYPALPPAVLVEGTVGGRVRDEDPPELTPATLELESYEIQLASAADATENLRLLFVRRVTAGDDGRYSVRLPPGRYKAAITPTPRVGAAPPATVYAKNASEDVRVGDTPSIQRGRFLRLRPAATVRGRCRLTDGRALAGATVVARPASVLSLPPEAPAARPASPATYPRAASAHTDQTGSFELALDAGRYDITIKPAPGTRMPWIVLSARFVGEEALDLGVLSVPAPIAAGLTVRDSNDNPIVRAIVRAYAVPAGGTVAVPIGDAMTNADGRFEMDLAGSPR